MEIKRLKELCIGKGEYGIAAAGEPFSEKKYRYLRITDISDYGELLHDDMKSVSADGCEKYLLEENDIVFARTGNSTGRTFFYEKKYGDLVYAGFLIKFHIDKEKVNPKYLKYYTISQTYKNWINNGPTGSTRGNMSEGDFADLPIFLPDRPIQDKIVDFLDPISEKIECNNRILEECYETIRTLYKYWFVQFDFPDKNGKPYKASGNPLVWNERIKKEIPKDWVVKSLEDISDQVYEMVNPSSDTDYYHYSIPAYDDGAFPVIENGGQIDSGKYKVPSNGFLLSKLNPRFKRLWVVSEVSDNSICSTEFIPIKAKALYYDVLFAILDSNPFYTYMVNSSSSSTGSRKRMDPELCKKYYFAMPQEQELVQCFSENTHYLIKTIVAMNKENGDLKRLRNDFLPLAINEKIIFKNMTSK